VCPVIGLADCDNVTKNPLEDHPPSQGKRNSGRHLGVLNDVSNDEKQYPRRNHCQTTIERASLRSK
jgi:hypothetical protein